MAPAFAEATLRGREAILLEHPPSGKYTHLEARQLFEPSPLLGLVVLSAPLLGLVVLSAPLLGLVVLSALP